MYYVIEEDTEKLVLQSKLSIFLLHGITIFTNTTEEISTVWNAKIPLKHSSKKDKNKQIVLSVNYNLFHNVIYNSILFTTVYCTILLSKTVSAKIPNKRHDELRERCNQLGCTINEYIDHSIEFALDGSTEFEFDVEEPEDTPTPSVIVTELE